MNDERTKDEIMVIVVDRYAKNLTDLELAILNTVGQSNMDPHQLFNYDKVEGLFTEQNGTRMNKETKIALAAIANRRLGGL